MKRDKPSKLKNLLLFTSFFELSAIFTNILVEDLRENHYIYEWAKNGSIEEKKRYWEAPSVNYANLLIPGYSFFNNRFE